MDKSKRYLLGMYEKSLPADLSWQDKLEQCRNAGFDWLEISIDETEEKLKRLDWNKEERRKLMHSQSAVHIRLRGSHDGFLGPVKIIRVI